MKQPDSQTTGGPETHHNWLPEGGAMSKLEIIERPKPVEISNEPIQSDAWKNLYQIEGEGMVWGRRIFPTEQAAIDHFKDLRNWPDPVIFTSINKAVPKASVKFAIPMPCAA